MKSHAMHRNTPRPLPKDFAKEPEAARLARVQAYVARTHDAFVANLRRADELGFPAHGAMAGPVARGDRK